MEFFSALDYFIFILFLLKMYSSIKMCIKYWMFQIMTELHVNKEDIFLILKTQSFDTKVIKFQTRISRSVDIQIRPTFDLYCRLRNSLNFDQNMMFEWARLKTYKSAPETLCAWKIKLAKAGFFYTGVDHKCKCAFCGFSYDVSSETGDPDDVHRRLNPSCPLLVDRVNTNNIAIDADERALFQRRSLAFSTSSSRNFQYPAVFTGGHVSRFQTGGYAIDLDSTEEVDSYVRRILQGLQVPPNEDRQISNTSESENRQREGPINLTKSKSPDSTTVLDSYVRLIRQILQVPPNEDRQISNISERENRQREGPINLTKSKSPVSKMCERPKFPQYDSISIRLSTFSNWPTHLTQSPREMASAGFFYAGYSDYCRCFFCGGGLRSWEPGDQPWTEHARYFSECPLVRQRERDDFKDIQINRNLQIAKFTDEQNRYLDLTSDPINCATENNEFSSHPAVTLVSELGYGMGLIKKAYDLLQLSGVTEIKATVLLKTVHQIVGNETENGYAASDATPSAVDNFTQFQETSRRLEEENQNLKDLCKICLDEQTTIVFLPCGHLACCEKCAPALRKCPMCRAFIKGKLKTFLR